MTFSRYPWLFLTFPDDGKKDTFVPGSRWLSQPCVPFTIPLKTLDNVRFSDIFKGGNKRVGLAFIADLDPVHAHFFVKHCPYLNVLPEYADFHMLPMLD